MKRSVALLTCTTLLAGSLMTCVSADEPVKAPKLITAAPTESGALAELDLMLSSLGLPIDTQSVLTGIADGTLSLDAFSAMLADVDPAILTQLLAKLTEMLPVAPEQEEEATDDLIKIEIAATERNTNVVFGDSNVTGGAAVVAGAPAENTFAASAYRRFSGDTAVFAANGATSEALAYLLADEESAAILAENAKNAKFWTINMGGNDFLHALVASLADVELNVTVDAAEVLAEAVANTPAPEAISPEMIVAFTEALTAAGGDIDIASAVFSETVVAEEAKLALAEAVGAYVADLKASIAGITQYKTADIVAGIVGSIEAAAVEASGKLIANLNAFIGFAQTANPNLKVFVNGIPMIELDSALTYSGNADYLAVLGAFDYAPLVNELNKLIETALPENAYFIDVNPTLAEVEDAFNEDGIHFTDDAQAALGKKISNFIVTTEMRNSPIWMLFAR